MTSSESSDASTIPLPSPPLMGAIPLPLPSPTLIGATVTPSILQNLGDMTIPKIITPETSSKKEELVPGLLAGIARSVGGTLSLLVLTSLKGLLKFWFRVPIKLFRPYAVNPWWLFQSMAQHQGQKVDVSFMRQLYSAQGWKFIYRNSMPILAMNSAIGIALFNSYTLSKFCMDSSILSPFLAGAFAGATQSLLATPLETLQRSMALNPSHLVQNAHVGMVQLARDHALNTLPRNMRALPILYRGIGLNLVRDTLGFSCFFGVFETLRNVGNTLVSKVMPNHWKSDHPWFFALTKGLVLVTAGGCAGLAFQSISYPIDRFRSIKVSRTFTLLKRSGLAPFYKGFTAQLWRVMPASALALVIYETTAQSLSS